MNLQALYSALSRGATVLTPNSRLKRALLKSWSLKAGSGLKPNILSLGEWLQTLWQQHQATASKNADRQLITPLQSQYIWQSVIQKSASECDLINPLKLSQNAASACKTLELWQKTVDDLAPYDSDSNEYFIPWVSAFHEALEQQNLATQEFAIHAIIAANEHSQQPKDKDVYLYAFEQIPPLHEALITSHYQNLHSVDAMTADNSHAQHTSLPSFEDEVHAAAVWSQQIIEKNRNSRVGIIALNLGQCRNTVERIFTEVFEPQSLLADVPSYTLPFNFSAGVPLSSVPIISDALKLLGLQKDSWPVDDICQLLNSPFWGDPEQELALRAEVCDQLLGLSKPHISGSDLRYRTEQISQKMGLTATITTVNSETSEYSLSKSLQNFASEAKRQSRHHSAQQWASIFQQQLNTLGWPGTRKLNSHEHQQVAQWYELLQDFNQLDACGLPISHSSALKALASLCQSHHFQAQTPDSPIHILGALEGAGLNFDACWVLGMNARSWPSAPAPNPLLPIDLQRSSNMPHASTERELHIAEALTKSYQHCAASVIFSSASAIDGNTDHPSSLIKHLPYIAADQLIEKSSLRPSLQDYQQCMRAAAALEKQIDNTGPSVSSLEMSQLKGGSSLFRDQASCPLIAFAKHRLGAKTYISPSAGLSAIDRGNIIHAVLELVWLTLKTSTKLHSRSDDELSNLCQTAIEKAIAPYRQKLAQQLPDAFFALEAERLLKLSLEWLEQDKQRAAFDVIACEQKSIITFEGITLELRLDRLDQVEGGELLLIDYKTGKPKVNQWQGQRPEEPQLPLYALTAQSPDTGNQTTPHQTIAAIAFARVDKVESQLVGLGNLAESVGGKINGIAQPEDCPRLDLPDNWQDVIDYWKTQLSQLATDFKTGCAAVDYRDINAQRYSEDYHPLTRILEQEQVQNYTATHAKSCTPATENPPQPDNPPAPVQGELL